VLFSSRAVKSLSGAVEPTKARVATSDGVRSASRFWDGLNN